MLGKVRMTALAVAVTLACSGLALAYDRDNDKDDYNPNNAQAQKHRRDRDRDDRDGDRTAARSDVKRVRVVKGEWTQIRVLQSIAAHDFDRRLGQLIDRKRQRHLAPRPSDRRLEPRPGSAQPCAFGDCLLGQ